MEDLEYVFKKYFFEFLKKSITLRPGRLFKFNRFCPEKRFFYYFILKITAFEKTVKND